MASDLFKQINNAVLDLQAADYQGTERPIRQLAKLLRHDDLAKINGALIQGVDLDAFLGANDRTGGSMVGSHKLRWPDDAREDLAMRWLLIQRLPEGDFAFQF